MPASQDSRKTSSEELPPQHHYVVISSDSHAGADLLDYKPYLESKWHDEFDAWAASYSNPWDFVDPRLDRPGRTPPAKLPSVPDESMSPVFL